MDQGEDEGLRARGEEAIGELAQSLLGNPVFGEAMSRALGAGELAIQAQKSALGALDVASAADTERLTRRIRALSDRIEALEDTVDALAQELVSLRAPGDSGSGSERTST